MLNTSILAGILGPMLVIMGLWTLCCRPAVKQFGESLQKDAAARLSWIGINLLVGLTIINVHPYWDWDITTFLTALGWVFTLRALFMLYVSKAVPKVVKLHTQYAVAWGIVSVAWGLVLCHLAFNYFA